MASGDTTTRTDILNIQVNYKDALDSIARYNREIELMQANQTKLKQELASGAITQQEYGRAMAASRVEVQQAREGIRLYEREIRNGIKAQTEAEGSIKSLRGEVNNLTAQYDAMSKAQRNSAEGKAFLDNLNNIKSELNEAVEASQRFQHNVGNYPDAFIQAAAGGNQFAGSLLQSVNAGKGLTPVLKSVGTQILAIGKAVIANPIGAIIAAVVVVVLAFKKAIDSSEESLNAFNRILAPIRLVLDVLLGILQKVVGVVLRGVEAFLSMAMALSRLAERLPIVGGLFKQVNDEVERGIRLERDKQALEAQNRVAIVANAKTALEIAQLRSDAEDKLNRTTEQRLFAVRRANELERQMSEGNVKRAEETLRIRQEELRYTQKTADEKRELAELEAAVYNEQLNYYNKSRELMTKENELVNSIAEEAKKRREDAIKGGEEYRKNLEEQLNKQLEARRLYEQGALRLLTDARQRARAELNASYANEIADLTKRLATEKNLTTQARTDLNAALVNLRKEWGQELDRLDKQLENERLEREAERIRTDLQNQLALLKQNGAAALAARLNLIELEREAELRAAEETGANRLLITQKYDKLIADERIATERRAGEQVLQEQRQAFERMALEAQLNGESTLAIDIERRTLELAALKQLEDESDAAYLERRKIMEAQLALLQQNRANEVREGYEALIAASANMFGAFSDLLDQYAEQNEAFAVFSKSLALFQILLSTGEAISKGVAAAQSVPFPANIAAIATTVATITANIAQATQIVNKAKAPKANAAATKDSSTQYFSRGGSVFGTGSSTSDSIPAYLSNGESVLTARATEMFAPVLSAFNQLGGGVPISTSNAASTVFGEAMLTRIFARALEELPNPIVAVSEIQRVSRSVEVLETDARS